MLRVMALIYTIADFIFEICTINLVCMCANFHVDAVEFENFVAVKLIKKFDPAPRRSDFENVSIYHCALSLIEQSVLGKL